MAAVHPDKLLLKITVTSAVLGICFVAFLIFLFVSYQKNSAAEIRDTSQTLSEETVLSIREQINEIKRIEEKRKENFQLNEKPFEDGDYSYDERTVDFRLVCKRDCPVSKEVLDQEFAAIAYAVSTVRGLTQSDITPEILPFEVHASEDARCPMLQEALAYKTSYTDSQGYTRGLLCFFYDKLQYDRSKFPYSTSVHEVMHLFEENKVPYKNSGDGWVLGEGLSEMLESFFVKGNDKNSFCWQGNAWYKQALQNNHDAHWIGGDLFFELCKQYGLDYDDLPELFGQLELQKGQADEQEFVNIVNNIVRDDTSQLFRNAGVI